MEYLDEENYPVKRPVFLTVLCVLTFIGSGWSILGAFTTYKTAGNAKTFYSDSALNKKSFPDTAIDSLKTQQDSLYPGLTASKTDSLQEKPDSSSLNSLPGKVKNNEAGGSDTVSPEFTMGRIFGEKMKKNIMDMMSVEKIKKSAMGSFIAGLFTLWGALLMWFLKKSGFYVYSAGIVIGLVFPFFIYGNNLLAVGVSGFSSFFGLVFIALYALNLKSMR